MAEPASLVIIYGYKAGLTAAIGSIVVEKPSAQWDKHVCFRSRVILVSPSSVSRYPKSRVESSGGKSAAVWLKS